jgi:hypothetical protein
MWAQTSEPIHSNKSLIFYYHNGEKFVSKLRDDIHPHWRQFRIPFLIYSCLYVYVTLTCFAMQNHWKSVFCKTKSWGSI